MKSRISIRVDLNNQNQPIIRVDESGNSDDLRDQMITQFRRKLGDKSSWLKVKFNGTDIDGGLIWIIEPLSVHDLAAEVEEMNRYIVGLPTSK